MKTVLNWLKYEDKIHSFQKSQWSWQISVGKYNLCLQYCCPFAAKKGYDIPWYDKENIHWWYEEIVLTK